MSHDVNSRLLRKIKSCINIAIHARTCSVLIHGFYLCSYRAPRKARANNEKVKSARNENKNESFYAYENVMRL